MLSQLRTRLTYANVMATIAVFGVIGGGGAYAASKIGPNEIRNNAVHSKHIDRNHVRAKQVHPRSVGRFLGIRSTGRIALEAGSADDERVLARSGPISLVGTCEWTGGNDSIGVLTLRSANGLGSYIGVRYERPAELTQIGDELIGGTVLAEADSDLDPYDAAASFTASSGDSTLSGEARVETTIPQSCHVSFNGIAG